MNDLLFFFEHWMSIPRGGWDSLTTVKDGNTFYVHTTKLEQFLDKYAESERNFVLVTEGSDMCLYEDKNDIIVCNGQEYDIACRFNKNKLKNIKRWFATNNNTKLPIYTVPCGFWRKITYIPNEIKFDNKINKILLCCSTSGNPAIRSPIKSRFQYDKNVKYYDMPNFEDENSQNRSLTTPSHLHLLSMVNSFRYMFCPESNGLDTNRLWECLLLGVIPIVNNLNFYQNIRNISNIIIRNILKLNTLEIINLYQRLDLQKTYHLYNINNPVKIDKNQKELMSSFYEQSIQNEEQKRKDKLKFVTKSYWLSMLEKAENE